ncbi:hypothetical protein AB0I22_06030 [Streptomyces sp. NPDC050610]
MLIAARFMPGTLTGRGSVRTGYSGAAISPSRTAAPSLADEGA